MEAGGRRGRRGKTVMVDEEVSRLVSGVPTAVRLGWADSVFAQVSGQRYTITIYPSCLCYILSTVDHPCPSVSIAWDGQL